MKKLGVFYFMFLLISPFSCTPDQVKVTSAKIDQVLIPILFDLSNNNFDNAQNSTANLSRQWHSLEDSMDNFEEDYSDKYSKKTEYIEDRINHLSFTISKEEKDASIFIFEEIQTALSDWRTDHNMDYYVDDLFKFKYDVDIFTCIAEDELLDLCDWEELEWQYENIQASFYFLNTVIYDLEYFDMEEVVLREKLSNINVSVMNMNVAMDQAQREEVERIAHILQRDVLETIFVFAECGEAYAAL